jgi:peptide/nickel transport system permease protein
MVTDFRAPAAPFQAATFSSPTRRVWSRFRRNTVGVTAAIIVALFFVTAVITGLCAWSGIYFPHDPNATNLALKLKPPSLMHWLGTDNLGRDVFSRMLNGSYISLTVGFIAVAVSLFIGVTIGAISGYLGGWVDNVIMRVVDAILCFPTFFLILTAVALLGPNIIIFIVVIGLVAGRERRDSCARSFLPCAKANTCVPPAPSASGPY